jgi:predicted dienelactone hydrolase
MSRTLSLKLIFLLLFIFNLNGQNQEASFLIGSKLPDAPLLSSRGEYKVGVKTVHLVHHNQIDIVNSLRDRDSIYDRPLTVEIWYPARLSEGESEEVIYEEVMGNFGDPNRPLIPFTFTGKAARDAKPETSGGPYPLIIVSHGYTGSRYLMTYLTENLASKGYVVVAIDHTDSTFRDATSFNSTLLNRSLDDLFILNEIDRLSKIANSFLAGLVHTNSTGLIGYSMGGYGALNVAGGGYSKLAVGFFASMSKGNKALEKRMQGNPEFKNSFDSRIKAVVAMAPWGMERGVWDAEGLAGIKIPTFYIAGSKDDISGYEKGIKAIYDGAVNSDRYLLTYENARHNIAPNPPPAVASTPGLHIDEYLRYADSVWDQRRINNINQHFITAFLGIKLKNKTEYSPYINAKELKNQDPWEGFLPRTSVGMELLHEKAN